MEWSRRFPQNVQPNLEQIAAFAGTPLWAELCTWLETEWNVRPLVQYSSCSGAKGWNVKYRKSGRALCTLYPGLPGGGSFTCLVAVGQKQAMAAEACLGAACSYVQNAYRRALADAGREEQTGAARCAGAASHPCRCAVRQRGHFGLWA